MTADLTQDDRGKTLVRQSTRLGTVTDVDGATVYVEIDQDHVPDDLRETLGWDGDDVQTLSEDAITAVQNSEVRLRTDL